MHFHHQKFKINNLEIESFYDYDSLFKDILLQYKECYDEALKNVFLNRIENYLRIKYFGYAILYVPSTTTKINERGFNHLELIFEKLNFKKVEGLVMKNELNQKSKSLVGRTKMENNFSYNGKNHKKILIVDDVYTSGSTLRGVYKEVKNKCCKCRAIVLAKT